MENRVFYNFSDENDGNLAFHVEDNEINVIKNRKNLALKLGYNYEDLVYMNQIHSANIMIVDENTFEADMNPYSSSIEVMFHIHDQTLIHQWDEIGFYMKKSTDSTYTKYVSTETYMIYKEVFGLTNATTYNIYPYITTKLETVVGSVVNVTTL